MQLLLKILSGMSNSVDLPNFESNGLSVQEKKIKIDFSIFSSSGRLVHQNRTIFPILVESPRQHSCEV